MQCRHFRSLLPILVASLIAAGCSDDSEGGGPVDLEPADAAADVTPDVAPDVGPDVAQDTAPDIAPDVAPDVGPDVQEPDACVESPEVCDGVDNDCDGEVDEDQGCFTVLSTIDPGIEARTFALAADPESSGFYATGKVWGPIFGEQGAGAHDIFVARYGEDGTRQMFTLLAISDFNDEGNGIAVSPDGQSIYVGGNTKPSATGGWDAVAAAVDAAGQEKWTKKFITSGFDSIEAVATGPNGELYITGYTEGSLEELTNQGDRDGFLMRLDTSNGGVQWARSIATPYGDYPHSLAVDPSTGDIYVGGSTRGDLDDQTHLGGHDGFIVKFSDAGDRQWTRMFGTDRYNYVRDIAFDAANGVVYAAGGNKGGTQGNEELQGFGWDIMLVGYDRDGNEHLVRNLGGSSTDEARAIYAAPDGTHLAIGGYAQSVLPSGEDTSGDSFVAIYSLADDAITDVAHAEAVGKDRLLDVVYNEQAGVWYFGGYFSTSIEDATAVDDSRSAYVGKTSFE